MSVPPKIDLRNHSLPTILGMVMKKFNILQGLPEPSSTEKSNIPTPAAFGSLTEKFEDVLCAAEFCENNPWLNERAPKFERDKQIGDLKDLLMGLNGALSSAYGVLHDPAVTAWFYWGETGPCSEEIIVDTMGKLKKGFEELHKLQKKQDDKKTERKGILEITPR